MTSALPRPRCCDGDHSACSRSAKLGAAVSSSWDSPGTALPITSITSTPCRNSCRCCGESLGDGESLALEQLTGLNRRLDQDLGEHFWRQIVRVAEEKQ